MRSGHVVSLQVKLERRVNRLKSTGLKAFQANLRQFLTFLRSHPVFAGIVEGLEHFHASLETEADRIVGLQRLDFDEELKNVAVSFFVLKKCADHPSPMQPARIGGMYDEIPQTKAGLEPFKLVFVDPVYHYLDEQLDEQRSLLALLRRYKQKCEWFQRDHLFTSWQRDVTRGERILQRHLYEYLHDQGFDFVVEPSSPSGEVDLLGDQKTDQPLVADTKIFNPSKGKGRDYIARGFSQVYSYAVDYCTAFGYLIIYNTAGNDLKLDFASSTRSMPHVIHNNKTIFLLVIDIFPHERTASKRGRLKAVLITEQDLIRHVAESSDA